MFSNFIYIIYCQYLFCFGFTDLRTGKWKCPHCSYEINQKQIMNDHIATHFFKTIHVCNICDYKAETKRRLIRHAQRIHGIDSF